MCVAVFVSSSTFFTFLFILMTWFCASITWLWICAMLPKWYDGTHTRCTNVCIDGVLLSFTLQTIHDMMCVCCVLCCHVPIVCIHRHTHTYYIIPALHTWIRIAAQIYRSIWLCLKWHLTRLHDLISSCAFNAIRLFSPMCGANVL